MPFYERGSTRIYYEEVGAGFPLLIIPGGGLNSTIEGLRTSHPFNPLETFQAVTSGASPPTCGMLRRANPPGRWRLTDPGMPSPTTTWA